MSIRRRSRALAASRLFFITFSGTGLLLLVLLQLKLSLSLLLDFRFRLLMLLLLLMLFDEEGEPDSRHVLEPFVLLLPPAAFLLDLF